MRWPLRGSAASTPTSTPSPRERRGASVNASSTSSTAGSSVRPSRIPGSTRLYLSGPDAKVVSSRWTGQTLDVRVLDGPVGAASALKSCFAAWTKGSAALLLTVRALARVEGVEDSLLSEWATSIPDLEERSEHAATGNGPKAWRFVGEMHEISASLADAGLPAGFATAAAEVYERLAGLRNDPHSDIATVIEHLVRDA